MGRPVTNQDELQSIVQVRRDCGLPPVVAVRTTCLRCGSTFISPDYPRVRICLPCKWVENYVEREKEKNNERP